MTVSTKQVLAVTAGLVVAAVMVLLGLWQMSSYEESTRDVSAARANAPAVALADNVARDGTITDIYGHRVTASGKYLPEAQVLVGTGDPLRVATVFKLDDGRHVTVVRGAVSPGAKVPSAPRGVQSIEGVFLAPDKPYAQGPADAAHPTLRIQELAQDWPTPLIGGYITLPEAASAAQGLAKAPVELPTAEGSPTHRGYALQWWVFAAGAIGFGCYAARGFAKEANRVS